MGFKVSMTVREEWVSNSVKEQLTIWASRQLSLAGRILTVNQVILASSWYLAICLSISDKALRGVKSLVRNFVWLGKKDKKTRARVSRLEYGHATNKHRRGQIA